MRTSTPSLALLLLALAPGFSQGCGSSEVAHSEPVTLKLSGIKEGDIRNASFSEDKSVSTESGNPYQRFLDNAQTALEGAKPGAVEVDKVVLTVSSDSTGIGSNGFAEIFKNVEVFLADSTTTTPVGKLETIEPSTSLEIPVSASSENLEALKPSLLNGSFKVGIRGDAQDSLPSKFDIRVNVQITFRAFE